MDIELTIGTVALIPIVVALVQVFKKLGLPTEYAPWANAVLSVAGYALMVAVRMNPRYEQPVEMALNALLIFLSAGGFYEVGSRTVASFAKK